ncbi:MAG TPA: TlpA disulfide reductase family protein [Gemmataceae bacterium]|nr:TlpA disulfide reductase family protein [Gemmataceae bacterium]
MWLAAQLLLWASVFLLTFLLLGTLRNLGRVTWRLEQLEALTPRRVGRSGLKLGRRVPDLPCVDLEGNQVRLHEVCAGDTLLVFLKVGCGPCQRIVPELQHLHCRGTIRVVAVQDGSLEQVRVWASEAGISFPVLMPEDEEFARRFEICSMPFAFLIDGEMVIRAKGITSRQQHIGFLLDDARRRTNHMPTATGSSTIA